MGARDNEVQFVDDQMTAEQVLRCAWLREHAEQLGPFDPTGQLSAALRDFADLIEATNARGWFV